MRITNTMTISTYLSNLNRRSSAMNVLQNQMSSGKKLARASDDPIAASKSIEMRANLSKVKQYSANVEEAKELLGQTEGSLSEINELLSRVYELTTSAASDSNGVDERAAIADEVKQLKDQIVSTANTNFKSNYIFGGQNITTKPFEVRDVSGEQVMFYNDANLNVDDFSSLKTERTNYEIGFGTSMDISYNGVDLLGSGSNNIYAVLNNLEVALRNGDSSVIRDSVGLVQNKQNDIITLLGEVGGKTNRVDRFKTQLDNDLYNYTSILEDTEGADAAEVSMQLQIQDTAYQAALASGSKLISRTLADFLA